MAFVLPWMMTFETRKRPRFPQFREIFWYFFCSHDCSVSRKCISILIFYLFEFIFWLSFPSSCSPSLSNSSILDFLARLKSEVIFHLRALLKTRFYSLWITDQGNNIMAVNFVAKAPAMFLRFSQPRLATFVKYAKVELTPPSPGELGQVARWCLE